MKYRPLPIEHELAELARTDPKKLVDLRGSLFVETARTRGFQLVTAVLRDLEKLALAQLRTGTVRHERILGRIEAIEEIRRSLTALLPDSQVAQVDWHDDETEDYVILDPTPSAKDEDLG